MLAEMDYALSGSYLDNGEPVEGSGFINKTFHLLNFGLPAAEHLDLRWVLRYADSDSTAWG